MLFIFMEKEIQGELKGFKPHQFKKPKVETEEENKPAEEEKKDEEETKDEETPSEETSEETSE